MVQEHYKLTRFEQESCLNFNAEESHAEVYTADPAMIRQMEKLRAARPDVETLVKEDAYSKTYHIPKTAVKIRPPRILSDKEKARLVEHAKEVNRKLWGAGLK